MPCRPVLLMLRAVMPFHNTSTVIGLLGLVNYKSICKTICQTARRACCFVVYIRHNAQPLAALQAVWLLAEPCVTTKCAGLSGMQHCLQ